MYYLVKDGKKFTAYYETYLGIAQGEWNGESFDWEEDICIFGNIIAEYQTEEELIKAYKEELQ
jgi:hypothetical protein